ncbi:MAG: CdaR family protein [Lachnospiraceae bacterium]|nr:CdaR family protein [Lachnospiraceae bacterium]
MSQKIHDFFTKNWGLKILAIILSVVLWIAIVNVDDPTEKRNFTAKISLENQEVVSEQGKYISVADSNMSVTFRVSAKRTIMDRLSNSDFVATADMNYLDDKGRVPIQISCVTYPRAVAIIGETHYLQVEVGEKQSKKFVIEGSSEGDPADGYAVKDIDVSPNVVTVEGPARIVKKIDHVEAIADVDGFSTDVSENVVPTFFDSDNKEINTTRLTLSVSTVKVNVTMDSVKSVPIEVSDPDDSEVPDGVSINEITVDPTQIDVQGSSDDLNTISKIVIPFKDLGFTETNENFETTVDISSYLPKSVKLVDSTKGKVKVTVDIYSMTDETFSVSTNNLKIRNLSDDYEASFDEDTVSVVLSGYENDLSEINASDLTGSVDASGLTEGQHTVQVRLDLPDGVTAGKATVSITLKKKDDNEGE